MIIIHHPILIQALLRDYSILVSAYLLEGKTKLSMTTIMNNTNTNTSESESSSSSNTVIDNVVPYNLAKPLTTLAQALDQPMIMEYSSYCLGNFYSVKDSTSKVNVTMDVPDDSLQHPVTPVHYTSSSINTITNDTYHWNNLRLIRSFNGGPEESTFILIHSEIESHIPSLIKEYQIIIDEFEKYNTLWKQFMDNDVVTNINDNHPILHNFNTQLLSSLTNIHTILNTIIISQLKMFNASNPRKYIQYVRPWIFGWKNNPDFPNGVIMQGIGKDGEDISTFLRGETGAQSTIIPSLDTFFGIIHISDELRIFLNELEAYRPLPHRQYLQYLRNCMYIDSQDNRPGGPINVEDNVTKHLLRVYLLTLNKVCEENTLPVQHTLYQETMQLIKIYNQCIQRIWDFRAIHVSFADIYIQRFTNKEYATGGTPYKSYLRKHRDESIHHQVSR